MNKIHNKWFLQDNSRTQIEHYGTQITFHSLAEHFDTKIMWLDSEKELVGCADAKTFFYNYMLIHQNVQYFFIALQVFCR